MASINYDTQPQSEEEMHAIRLILSQIKQQGLDPMAFMRVHSVTNASLNDLEPIWVQVLSTNPPLLIEDLALKPSEIIQFYKLTPGSWIRSVQGYLLYHVLRKPHDNNEPALRALLHKYEIKT